MAKKSLLEEAIAEAKRVREAAIADATKRLEENLTPSIKEMLASKLEEELELDENEEEDLNENSNSGFKEVKPKSTVKEAEDDSKDKDDDAPAEDDAPADDAPADDAPVDDDAPDAEDAPADEDPAAEGDPAAEEEKGKCPECGRDKENCICKENKQNEIQPEGQNGKEHHKEFTSGPSQDDELRKENQELREGLAKCKKVLQDVNLLNSKLIYTTRMLNRQGLSESQKVQAMQSLDEARTPKEVKLIYRTLEEGFKKSAPVLKEGRQTSRASRAAGKSTAAPKEVLTESNEMVRRFQQLAGIIKD